MPIAATRALLHAALSGELEEIEYREDPVFGFDVPVEVPGVDAKLLDPRAKVVRKLALAGGPAGLDLVRRLLREAAPFLAPGGHVVFEIGFGHDALRERVLREIYLPPFQAAVFVINDGCSSVERGSISVAPGSE